MLLERDSSALDIRLSDFELELPVELPDTAEHRNHHCRRCGRNGQPSTLDTRMIFLEEMLAVNVWGVV